MKRLLKTGALLAVAALACTSCKFVGVKGSFCDHGDGVLVASDNLITKDIEVSDFKSLDVNLPCDVKFSVGEKSVSVYAATTWWRPSRLRWTLAAVSASLCRTTAP